MIHVEIKDNRRVTTTDDSSKLLRKVGTDEVYSEAIDLLDKEYEYEEVDNPDVEVDGGV